MDQNTPHAPDQGRPHELADLAQIPLPETVSDANRVGREKKYLILAAKYGEKLEIATKELKASGKELQEGIKSLTNSPDQPFEAFLKTASKISSGLRGLSKYAEEIEALSKDHSLPRGYVHYSQSEESRNYLWRREERARIQLERNRKLVGDLAKEYLSDYPECDARHNDYQRVQGEFQHRLRSVVAKEVHRICVEQDAEELADLLAGESKVIFDLDRSDKNDSLDKPLSDTINYIRDTFRVTSDFLDVDEIEMHGQEIPVELAQEIAGQLDEVGLLALKAEYEKSQIQTQLKNLTFKLKNAKRGTEKLPSETAVSNSLDETKRNKNALVETLFFPREKLSDEAGVILTFLANRFSNMPERVSKVADGLMEIEGYVQGSMANQLLPVEARTEIASNACMGLQNLIPEEIMDGIPTSFLVQFQSALFLKLELLEPSEKEVITEMLQLGETQIGDLAERNEWQTSNFDQLCRAFGANNSDCQLTVNSDEWAEEYRGLAERVSVSLGEGGKKVSLSSPAYEEYLRSLTTVTNDRKLEDHLPNEGFADVVERLKEKIAARDDLEESMIRVKVDGGGYVDRPLLDDFAETIAALESSASQSRESFEKMLAQLPVFSRLAKAFCKTSNGKASEVLLVDSLQVKLQAVINDSLLELLGPDGQQLALRLLNRKAPGLSQLKREERVKAVKSGAAIRTLLDMKDDIHADYHQVLSEEKAPEMYQTVSKQLGLRISLYQEQDSLYPLFDERDRSEDTQYFSAYQNYLLAEWASNQEAQLKGKQ